ncbi:uncharacterized [Tachysurus ichikawai]
MYAVFPSIPSTLLSNARQGPQTNYSFVRGERVSRMHYHLAPWRGHLCLQRRRRVPETIKCGSITLFTQLKELSSDSQEGQRHWANILIHVRGEYIEH